MKNRTKNYPLYETTVFKDFRVMTENVANKYPNKVAYSFKENPHKPEITKKTFAETRRYIVAMGTGLVDFGVREKHIAIVGEASYNWVTSYYATMSIGAVTVPIDKELPAEDIKSIIESAECDFVIYSSVIDNKIKTVRDELSISPKFICMSKKTELDDVTMLSDIILRGEKLVDGGDNSYYDYELDPDKLASIVFTSGTTGKGKGVMLTQTNIVSDMTQGMYNFNITPKTLCVLPPHHTFGSTVNFVGHYAQGAEVYISNGLKYILNELKEQQPTHLILVPLFVETFYKRIWATAEKQGKDKMLRTMIKASNGMRKVGIDLRKKLFASVTAAFGGKLEMIICGGAALNQDIIDTFEGIGIVILNGYGITECAPLISCNRNEYRKKGSVGVPIIGEQVKIADPDENGEGEICVKGPNVMMGYYKNPEATAAAFDEEGYFKTGDFGKLDEEGWIYITGRLKNLIILSNGKNVYPEEIETEISRIYGVNEVVVYEGLNKDGSSKDCIVAEIYPDFDGLKDHGITDVQKYFKDGVNEINKRSAPYKKVQIVKIRNEEFEKNTSKKIVRFKINRIVD
ncbi:MAG: AMP-binding protein [Clostridia bacterium]|nr:AMP-binding protein [Clostridia bacterium]